MNRILLLFFCMVFISASAQKGYFTTQGEFIFSKAMLEFEGENISNAVRFTAFPNIEVVYNKDLGKTFGLYSGLTINNIGLITSDEDFLGPNIVNLKLRALTAGVPVALKIGNLSEDRFFAIGAQYEWLFHFKEKFFYYSGSGSSKLQKSKSSEWFSDKTNTFLPSVFVGISYNRYFLRVKYYLNDFLNQDYQQMPGFGATHPFRDINSTIAYISLSYRFNTKKSDD